MAGLARWRLWLALGYYDFVVTYRQTVLGPLWQIVHVSAWIFGLWLVFGGERGNASLLYIGIGVIHWGLFNAVLPAATQVLQVNKSLIMNMPNPLSIYLFRKMVEQVLRWAAQLPLVAVLMIAYAVPLEWHVLLVIPNFVLVLLILLGGSLALSVLGTRSPDLRFAVDAAMRLLFFMTPIFWAPGDDPLRSLIASWNPFTYLLDLLRQPLMGELPSLFAYQVAGAMAVLSLVFGIAVFNACRNRVLFWI